MSTPHDDITAGVDAVVLPVGAHQHAETVEAIRAQTHRPERIATGKPPSGSAVKWLWLVESGVVPERTALERLLVASAAFDGSEAPALLASRVLTVDGGLDPHALPVPEIREPDLVLPALEHGLVALRAARGGSLLVRADAFGEVHPRDARLALEWTVRLLGRAPGVLVPGSVAVRSGARRSRETLPSHLRALVALEPAERMWFAFHLAEHELAIRRAG